MKLETLLSLLVMLVLALSNDFRGLLWWKSFKSQRNTSLDKTIIKPPGARTFLEG